MSLSTSSVKMPANNGDVVITYGAGTNDGSSSDARKSGYHT